MSSISQTLGQALLPGLAFDAVGIAVAPVGRRLPLQPVGREVRDDAQGRQARQLLDVVRALDGVVDVVDEEDEAEPAEEAEEQGHHQVPPDVRRERRRGHEGPVDDLDVARPQAAELARDLDLVLLGDERAEEGPHVLDLDLEAAVEDGVVVHPDDVRPLRVEQALERPLLVQGRPVVGLGRAHGLADLVLEGGGGAVDPGLELDHLGVVGAVELALLLVLGLGLGVGRS